LRKLLKEFPQDIWIPAAGECDSCSAPYEVRINNDALDSDGTFGGFDWQIKHGPNCKHRRDVDTAAKIMALHGHTDRKLSIDADGMEINENNVVGWKYRVKQAPILSVLYDVYTHIGDTAACVKCGMIIPENPLILFGENGDGWLAAFCIGCDAVTGVRSLIRMANETNGANKVKGN